MAAYKWTVQRGKSKLDGVTVAAGAAEAQSDTLSINIDRTNLTRFEALELIDKVKQDIHAGPWPPL